MEGGPNSFLILFATKTSDVLPPTTYIIYILGLAVDGGRYVSAGPAEAHRVSKLRVRVIGTKERKGVFGL